MVQAEGTWAIGVGVRVRFGLGLGWGVLLGLMLGSDGEGMREENVRTDVTYRRYVGNDFPVRGIGVAHRWGVGNTRSAVTYQDL